MKRGPHPVAFVPSHLIFGSENSEKTIFLLHGILGSQKNWRGFARKLAERLPQWCVVTSDLRNHGASRGAAPPHTPAACAKDLARLAEDLGRRPTAIVAHSFSGKVALIYAREYGHGLRSLFVLDAPPGARPEGADENAPTAVEALLAAVRAIRMPVEDRKVVLDALRACGLSRRIVAWMSTNLARRPDGRLEWIFDLEGVVSMLPPYRRADLWSVVEHPPARVSISMIVGGKSDRWAGVEIAHLEDLAQQGRIHLDFFEDAGHWIHVDAPEKTLDLLVDRLEAGSE